MSQQLNNDDNLGNEPNTEWYFADRADILDYIISAWIEAENEYKQLGFEKARKLNLAVSLIATALISLTISASIKILWGD